MKPIRPTRSKTRIGVLNWLQKLNPFFADNQKEDIYNNEIIVAVHVCRYTGSIVKWETTSGKFIPAYVFQTQAA